ncbi:hypothetical protein [Mesorhizobium sp. KR9-304]|uniref:hypothetical protein n=1 Tax=Mesorhizobium sp. KR9-304 TaxID=3156614 RepID=UPI0032B58C87
MTDAPNDDTDYMKQPRFRSPPYPSIPLAKAIDRLGAFYQKALHHAVPITVAASAWEYAPKSSGLFATVAALKQFGFMTDEGSGDKRRFKLTDRAIRIVRDTDPKSEKRIAAIRAAALSPKIHSELWEQYGVAGASGAMDVAVKSYLTLDRADDGAAPYSNAAADELISEYRQTVTFAGLLESDDVSSNEVGSEDTDNLSDDEKAKMEQNLAGQQHRDPPPPPPPPPSELNDIRVEFFGGKVRINALMDKDGLEDLEKKIAAFKTILS